MNQMSLVSQTLSLLGIMGCIKRPMFTILQVQKMLPKTKTHSSNTTIWDFKVKILYIFYWMLIFYIWKKNKFLQDLRLRLAKRKCPVLSASPDFDADRF